MNATRLAIVLAVGVAVVPYRPHLAGEDVTGYVQFRITDSVARDATLSAEAAMTDTQAIDREIQLSFTRQAFPLVRFWGGGTFEDSDIDRVADDDSFEQDNRRLRPYFGVGRRGPTWLSQVSWSRDQRRIANFETSTTVREGLFGALARTPQRDSSPRLRMSLSRNRDYQVERRVPDSVSDLADLDINQRPGDQLSWSYRGTLVSRDDRAGGSDARTIAHRAEVRYTDEWLDRRVALHSEYSIAYRENRIIAGGSGDVDQPLFPLDGLLARDDTPLDGALDPAPALVDDDLDAATPIDLGLAAPGDDIPWSLGLEFAIPTAVNVLFVYIDRELEPDVAAAFSWQVYTSPNNAEWTLRQIVTGAPYDPFLRRFTIRFAELSVRYIKLVVPPLGFDVPGGAEFPDLFVTELDAAQRTPAPTGRVDSSDLLHRLNVDTRVRLLERRELYFLSNLNFTDNRGRRSDYRWSNGLYHTHLFAHDATLTSRLAWDETRNEIGNDSAFVYSSALQLRPVERLSYNLSLSGRKEEVADEIGGDQVSLFLYATADLYTGVYLQLGARRSYAEDIRGVKVPSTQLDFGARIEPRDDLLLQLNYTDSVSDRTPGTLIPEIFSRAAEGRVTFTPFPTVYLYGSYRLEWRSAQARDRVQSGAVSWVPFPAATFRLGLNYNETRRDLFDDVERVWGSTLRWSLNPRAYFELAYIDIRDENATRRLDNRNASAILRWGF